MLRTSLKSIFVFISIVNIFKKNISCKAISMFNLLKSLIRKKDIKQLK